MWTTGFAERLRFHRFPSKLGKPIRATNLMRKFASLSNTAGLSG